MKSLSRGLSVAAFIGLALAGSSLDAFAQQRTLRFGFSLAKDHPIGPHAQRGLEQVVGGDLRFA